MGLEEHQGGLHGDEDADEQHGHLLDRAPGKVVGAADLYAGGLKGQQGGQQNDDDLDNGGQGEPDFTEDGQAQHLALGVLHGGLVGQGAAENNGGHDHQQEDDVVQAADMDLSAGAADVGLAALGDVVAIGPHVHVIEHEQQHHHVKQQHGHQAQAPEEGHASGEAHEQGRVADGGEAAADVGDQEDEEDHDVAAALAPGVHLQQGTDHQHAGAGGAHQAGEHGAEQQQGHVDPGGTGQVALQGDVAGHAEQTEQQHDKGEVVVHDALQRRLDGGPGPVHHGEGDEEEQGPEGDDDGLVVLPPDGDRQGHHGDAKQDTGEGDAHPKGSRGLGDLSRLAARSQHRDAEQKQGRQKNRDFFQ